MALGGLTNTLLRALSRLGLADNFGNSRIPIYCLNLAYPLIPDEVKAFCVGKSDVLIVEEGFPDYIEQAVNSELRRADIQTRIHGKGALPKAGEYTSEVMLRGIANFLAAAKPAGVDSAGIAATADKLTGHRPAAAATVGELPPRPPNFCTGCPERPVFAAIKLTQREIGPTHISADIGCHSFATFAPFSMGNSILGYGMSLASAAAVAPNLASRPISVMGDGGFWHNGLITGVASNLFNKGDGVLIVMQNGYTSATGQQYMPSSKASRQGSAPGMDIASTLRSFGVKWLRTVRSYSVATMAKTLKEAMRTAERGLKVIIADGECQLARQRRVRAEDAREAQGRRARRAREIRRRRRDLHRRPFLHPPLRLPVAHREADPRSAAHRSGRDRDRVLRRLRAVRRGRARRRAVPLVLPRRGDSEPDRVGPRHASRPPRGHRLAHPPRGGRVRAAGLSFFTSPRLRGEVGRAKRGRVRGTLVLSRFAKLPLTPTLSPAKGFTRSGCGERERTCACRGTEPHMTEVRPITLLIAALGGEGGGVLTDWIVSAAEHPGCRCSRPRSPASRSAPAPPPITSRFSRCRTASSAASARCWRSRPASATSTSWWRAS